MATKPSRRLTPKVRELVATDRQSRPPVGSLTPDEIELLTAVVRREGEFDVPVSAYRAIAALAAGAPPDAAVPVLTSVLADRTAPPTDRVAAARGLGQIGTPAAEQALLRQVREPNPRMQQDVLAALGTFAGPDAARELDRLPVPDDPATRRQLAFTRALIAHRHGLQGPFLPQALARGRPAAPAGQMTSVELAPKAAAAITGDRDRLRGSTYAIRLSERGYSVRCGPSEWTIFVNQEVGPSLALPRLFDRPWIAAVLAQWLPEGEAVVTRLVLLTRPVDKRLHIDVVRSDGQVAYIGEAHQDGSAIAFSIADVDRPGTAPTNIAGRVTPTGVELQTSVASAVRVGTRATHPVIVP